MRVDWEAIYLDGRSAARHPATVRLARVGLEIHVASAETLFWRYGEVRQTQGFYAGEHVRLERGQDRPEAVLVADPAFLESLRDAGAEGTRTFHDPRRRRRRVVLTAVAALLTVAAIAVLHRWGIPALASVVAARVPVSWEERLGGAIAVRLAPPERRCVSPAAERAIAQVVERLAGGSEQRAYTFRVVVLRGPSVNAFAAPGGYVFLLRGLVERLRTPEELAGVLAHEMQHVIRRHATRQLVQQASTALLVTALAGDASGLMTYAAQGAGTLGTLAYSRAHEEEADTAGLRMLVAARVDPAGMIAFFEQAASDDRAMPRGLEYLSTHPPADDRLARLNALARDARGEPRPVLTGGQWRDVLEACRR